MGLFDGRSETYSSGQRRTSSHHGSTRGYSPARSASGSKGYFVRPSANSRSRSSSSFFGFGGGGLDGITRGWGGGGSSYYKRSPRQGYISYLFSRLRRMFRELWSYARRHPMKAFFAVVVPLVSAGGAIHGLMKQFGVKVPGMDSLGGGGARRGGGGYYGSSGYGGNLAGLAGGGGGGLMDNAGSLFQIAKAFM